jgi:hypothetical protein
LPSAFQRPICLKDNFETFPSLRVWSVSPSPDITLFAERMVAAKLLKEPRSTCLAHVGAAAMICNGVLHQQLLPTEHRKTKTKVSSTCGVWFVKVSNDNAGRAAVPVARVQDVSLDMLEFGRITWEARATLEGSTHLATNIDHCFHFCPNLPGDPPNLKSVERATYWTHVQLTTTLSNLPALTTTPSILPHHSTYHDALC